MSKLTKMKKAAAVVLSCLTAVLTITSCSRNATISRIRQNGTLHVGYVSCAASEDVPFVMAENQGLTAEPAAQAAKALDVSAAFTRLTAEDAYATLLGGGVDCLWNVAPPEKSLTASVRTIETGIYYRQMVMTTADSKITRLADVKGKTMAVVSGSDAQTELHNAAVMEGSLKAVKICGSMQEVLTALAAGEASCAAVDEPQALYGIEQYQAAQGEQAFRFIETPIAESQLVIAARAEDGELCSRIAERYVRMAQDGEIRALCRQYTGSELNTSLLQGHSDSV